MKKFKANLICSLSIRSDFYIIGLVKNNIPINKVIILDDKKNNNKKFSKKIFLKFNNFEIKKKKNFDLISYLKEKQISFEVINCKTINNKKVYSKIKSMTNEKYFIVSLFPGDIIKKNFFKLKKYFFHAHAGYLPYYRGSTTNYYSHLDNKGLGVSIIILNEHIDRGNIIFRLRTKYFKSIINYDSSLDPFLRAYALCLSMKKFFKIKKLKIISNNSQKGEDYYIIHPVLKNLSILKK
jgi:methionyl-tRNA formyltransferase